MTLTEAQTWLSDVSTAYFAALGGRTVSYQQRSVGYQDIEKLSAERDKAQDAVNKLTAAAAGATNPGVRIATWS